MNKLNAQVREYTKGWPEYEARQYEWAIVLANLWSALAEHPLIRRIRPLRQHCEHRQLLRLSSAAKAEQEALDRKSVV